MIMARQLEGCGLTPPTLLRGKLLSQNGSYVQLLYPTIRKLLPISYLQAYQAPCTCKSRAQVRLLVSRTDAAVDLDEIATDLLWIDVPRVYCPL